MAAASGSDSQTAWTPCRRSPDRQISSFMFDRRAGFCGQGFERQAFDRMSKKGHGATIESEFVSDDDVEVLEDLLVNGVAGQVRLREFFRASNSDYDARVWNIRQMQHLEIEARVLHPSGLVSDDSLSFPSSFPSSIHGEHSQPSLPLLSATSGFDTNPDFFPLRSIISDSYGFDSPSSGNQFEEMIDIAERRGLALESLEKEETSTSLEALPSGDAKIIESLFGGQGASKELDAFGMEPLFMLEERDSLDPGRDGNEGEGLPESQLLKSSVQAISRVMKKIHNKRAKYQHLNLLEDKARGISSRASQPPSSNSSQGGSASSDHRHRLLSSFSKVLSSQLPLGNGDGDSMESENDDDEDKDNENIKSKVVEKVAIDLTDDLLHKVFSFLDDNSLCSAAMVCRQWRVASAHEDFWKLLNFEDRKVSSDQVVRLCRKYPKALELNLKGVNCVDEVFVRKALCSMRCLQALILGRGTTYSDGVFNALGTECPALKKLSITEAALGSNGSQEIQFRHESLCSLEIVKCRVLRITIKCPCLESLSLKRTSTASASLVCPVLMHLDVSSCHKLSDAGVRAAATACQHLASLNLSNCSYVSDDTLRDIANACSNLRSLDASYCPNISLEGVRLPMLVEMNLMNCEGINASSMTALSHCIRLEVLKLDFCGLLTSVALDLPQLQSISLTNCRKFVELTLRSPSLTSVVLTNCPALNRININSSSLQRLHLSQQQVLATITLKCPSLREIDLSECDSLSNSVCEIFSDGGGCSRLTSLILDNCEGISAVKLSTRSLRTLSLVSCRNIHRVDLACPNLDSLQLDGCDRLASASFCPVGLQALNLGICPHLTSLSIDAPEMTGLDLRGCGILSHTDICCPKLCSLDASYCSQLTDNCLAAVAGSCPSIESLVLASCPLIGSMGLSALNLLSGLKVLDLSYTFLMDLSPIYEACPRLQVLKLSACKYLASDALNALHGGKALPNLLDLDLSYGSLDRGAIEGLLSNCPHLVHVSLNGCANVYDLDWDSHPWCSFVPVCLEEGTEPVAFQNGGTRCDSSESPHLDPKFENEKHLRWKSTENISFHALQTLNCVGCPNIKRVSIPNSARCINLCTLNLSLSSNIREVKISCTNLLSLNLSNCVSLEEIKLDCPRLSSLFLQACAITAAGLEKAVVTCAMLETLDVRNCFKVTSGTLSQVRILCPMLKRLYSTPM